MIGPGVFKIGEGIMVIFHDIYIYIIILYIYNVNNVNNVNNDISPIEPT